MVVSLQYYLSIKPYNILLFSIQFIILLLSLYIGLKKNNLIVQAEHPNVHIVLAILRKRSKAQHASY